MFEEANGIYKDPNLLKRKTYFLEMAIEFDEKRKEQGDCSGFTHGGQSMKEYKEAAKRASELASKWL